MSEADEVLQSIDQLRRDLSGYHGQLKAHDDLARHCENQRRRIGELEGLFAKAKAERDETAMAFSKEHDRADFLMRENAELRERVKGFLGQRDERLAAAETRCNELRELVRHMGACIQHLDRTDEDGGCVRCPYQTLEHDCGFEQRMRELGIETS